jgi:hypothetical protein
MLAASSQPTEHGPLTRAGAARASGGDQSEARSAADVLPARAARSASAADGAGTA